MSGKWKWTATLRSEPYTSIKKKRVHAFYQTRIGHLSVAYSQVQGPSGTCCAHHPSYSYLNNFQNGSNRKQFISYPRIGNVITECLFYSTRWDNRRPAAFMYLSTDSFFHLTASTSDWLHQASLFASWQAAQSVNRNTSAHLQRSAVLPWCTCSPSAVKGPPLALSRSIIQAQA
jgi:hypothetical protein